MKISLLHSQSIWKDVLMKVLMCILLFSAIPMVTAVDTKTMSQETPKTDATTDYDVVPIWNDQRLQSALVKFIDKFRIFRTLINETGHQIGGNFQISTNSKKTSTVRTQALRGEMRHYGTGMLTDLSEGIVGLVYNMGKGIISNAEGGRFAVGVIGSGNIKNATGVAISSPYIKGAGSIDTNYGLRIADMKVKNGGGIGSVGSAFGVYVDGNNVDNYFAGNIGIGTKTPSTKLEVAGSIKLSGSGSSIISDEDICIGHCR